MVQMRRMLAGSHGTDEKNAGSHGTDEKISRCVCVEISVWKQITHEMPQQLFISNYRHK